MKQHFLIGAAGVPGELLGHFRGAPDALAEHLEILFRGGRSFPDVLEQPDRAGDDLEEIVELAGRTGEQFGWDLFRGR